MVDWQKFAKQIAMRQPKSSPNLNTLESSEKPTTSYPSGMKIYKAKTTYELQREPLRKTLNKYAFQNLVKRKSEQVQSIPSRVRTYQESKRVSPQQVRQNVVQYAAPALMQRMARETIPHYEDVQRNTVLPRPQMTKSLQAIRSGSSLKGTQGRKGRPVGTVKYRDAQGNPMGVYQYRKYRSAMNKMQRYQESLAQQQNVYPQQLQQLQQMQMQLQSPTSQQPQSAPVSTMSYQQPYPQAPPQAIRRPVVDVFKSSGGKPYPSLEGTQPLTPTRQTIPQGYIEEADMFSGRRILKPAYRAENWIRPKEFRQY